MSGPATSLKFLQLAKRALEAFGEPLVDLLIQSGIGVRTEIVELLELMAEELMAAADTLAPEG